jgi:hypothetical protein
MRGPHVRFRERRGGVILRAYSTNLRQRGTPRLGRRCVIGGRLLRCARNDKGWRCRVVL